MRRGSRSGGVVGVSVGKKDNKIGQNKEKEEAWSSWALLTTGRLRTGGGWGPLEEED